ncbi:hypothetical protein ACVBEF_06085 [Glaciimonas sp. GG7]
MKHVHHISNSGHIYRPPKPSQFDENTRKNAKFRAEFTSVHSSSLRALPTALSMQGNQPTPSSVVSKLLAIMTIGSVAGTVIPRPGNTSFPHSFSGGQNAAHPSDSPFGYCPKNHHSQTSLAHHAAPLRPPIVINSTPRRVLPDVKITKTRTQINKKKNGSKYPELIRPRQSPPPVAQPPYASVSEQSGDARLAHHISDNPSSDSIPHPPLSAAANSLSNSKERSFISDARHMLLGESAVTYISPDGPISGNWLLSGVNSKPNFSMMNSGWREAIRDRADAILRENERQKMDQIFIESIPFDPFIDSFSTYIDAALGNLFESEGLPRDAIHQRISARFDNERPVNAPHSHLQPKQPEVISHTAQWTVKQIATGENFYEIEDKAGPVTAHNMNDVTYHWPSNFTLRIKKEITTGWLWRTFSKLMTTRFTSGPLVDDAKRTIKAYATELFSRHYDGDPAQCDAQLTNFLQKARPVFFRGDRVAGLFVAPGGTAGSYGRLYSMSDTLTPVNVKHDNFRINYDALKEVVKNGLPLKKIIELGDSLFSPYLSKSPFPMHVESYLSFLGTPARVEDILWRAAIDKLFSDMDINVLSSDEKDLMLTMGLIKTGMKATMMAGSAPLRPLVSFAASVLSTLPDIGLAIVADNPNKSREHLTDFFVGLVIEYVGLQFFIGHKTFIMTRIAKSVHKLAITPSMRNIELSKLTHWATDYKNYLNLASHEKFLYLAQNSVAAPSGSLVKKLAQDANSWDFVAQLEHDAGLIVASQLEQITSQTHPNSFAAFLSTTPKLIKNQAEFLALPAGSRFGLISESGKLEHAMSKLDDGIAIGFKNDYLGVADSNAIQAFDLTDAISWGLDGTASINEGPTFTVQANPFLALPPEEKHPKDPLKRPKITIQLSSISTSSVKRPAGPQVHTKAPEHPFSVSPGNALPDLPQDDDIDAFEGLSALLVPSPLAINCTKQCTDQKIDTILTTLLARLNDLSLPAAAALQTKYNNAVKTALTTLSLPPPEDEWKKLPLPVRKLIQAAHLLEEHVNNFISDDALELATADYAQPLAASTFDRIYFDLQKPLMHTLEQDTTLVQTMRENPSEALTAYLRLDSQEKIDAFLNKIQEISTTNPAWRDITEERASPTLRADMLAYSSEMTAIFLEDFQQDVLPLPRSFDHLAWFYDYLQCKDAGQAWVFDPQKRTAQKIRTNFSRQLGLAQARPHMVTAILKAFRYGPDNMALSGSQGQSLYHLRTRSNLNNIPGYIRLTDRQKLWMFDALQARTGLSVNFHLGKLAASVDRMLDLFPDETDLAAMHYPEGVNALFRQIIALDLAGNNNVRKLDSQWVDDFWQLMLDRQEAVPGLENLIDYLVRLHPEHKADRVIATAYYLKGIAKLSPHTTMPAGLIDFAIQQMRGQLRTPLIGGDSPGTRSETINTYLDQAMARLGNQTQPTSMQEWKEWLTTQPTDERPLHARWIGPPSREAINATLSHAMQTIFQTRASNPSPLSTDPGEQRLAELLVRSGFDDVKMTTNGVESDVKMLGIEGLVTTVSERENAYGKAWYNDNFQSEQSLYAPMLARDALTGTFYSNKLPKGQKAATLEVASRRLGKTPSLALLARIRDDLTDFSDNNGTKTFDDIFIFKQADIDKTAHNPRTLFNDIYTVPLFRAIINAAKPYVGKWTLIYGQPAHIDPVRHFVYIPWDSQWQHLPKDFDLTGTPQAISAPRLYLEQWLTIFLQQRPAAQSDDDQNLTELLTNFILDQAGLLTYERISSSQPRTPLPIPERLNQLKKRRWEYRYAEALLTVNTPAQYRGAGVYSNESNAMTSTIEQLSSLQPQPLHLPMLSNISVEAGENSQQYLDNLLNIYHRIFDYQGIGARLMSKYRSRICAQSPWHFIYTNPAKTPHILKLYSKSHRIESYTQTVFLADPALHPLFYLTKNGLEPLDSVRQATHILLQILLSAPDTDDEQACTERSLAGPLTEIILDEIKHKSPSAIAAATIDRSQQIPTLTLLKNALSVARRVTYENKMIRDALWRHWANSQ